MRWSPLPLCLALVLLAPSLPAQEGPSTPGGPEFLPSTTLRDAKEWLLEHKDENGCIDGFATSTSWVLQALTAAGYDATQTSESGLSLLEGLKHCKPGDDAQTNDLAAHILGIAAAGENPRTFDGTDWIERLRSKFVGTQFGTLENPNLLNDDMFAILALRSANVPQDDNMIQSAADHIRSNQHSSGGWSYASGGNPDTDMTSGAILALTAANRLPEGDPVRGNARAFLEAAANGPSNGCFSRTQDGASADIESTTWATLAVLALEEDPRAEAWSETNSPWDCIRSYQIQTGNQKGGFSTDCSGNCANLFSTYQSVYALSAIPFGRLSQDGLERPTGQLQAQPNPATVEEPITLTSGYQGQTSWGLPTGEIRAGNEIRWTPNQTGTASLSILLISKQGVANAQTLQIDVGDPPEDTEEGGDGDEPPNQGQDGADDPKDEPDQEGDHNDPESNDSNPNGQSEDPSPDRSGNDDEQPQTERRPPQLDIPPHLFTPRNQTFNLTIRAQPGDAPIAAYRVAWGDARWTPWKEQPQFSRTFHTLTNLSLQVQARDENGLKATTNHTLHITNAHPTLQLNGPTHANTSELIQLQAQASDPDGHIANLSWQTPKGVHNTATINLTLTTPGHHLIEATATDNDGQETTRLWGIQITNHPPTLLTITPEWKGTHSRLELTAQAQDADNEPLNYTWNLDPALAPNTTTGPQITLHNPTSTRLRVNLTVEDPHGGLYKADRILPLKPPQNDETPENPTPLPVTLPLIALLLASTQRQPKHRRRT